MNRLFLIVLLSYPLISYAQNDRIADNNAILWTQIFSTIPVNKKLAVSGEVQIRRVDGIKSPQQLLLRTGLQIKLRPELTGVLGYAYVETYPYGDYPIASNGAFPEHRLYEQLQYKHAFENLGITQRIRIEQRFIGRRMPGDEREIEKWLFTHRFRYMLRMQYPVISGGNINLSVIAADEVFVSAGKNVGVNIFDQNRMMLLLGAKISNQLSVETGYINQTLIQGRRINNNTILQNNNGFVIALFFTP